MLFWSMLSIYKVWWIPHPAHPPAGLSHCATFHLLLHKEAARYSKPEIIGKVKHAYTSGLRPDKLTLISKNLPGCCAFLKAGTFLVNAAPRQTVLGGRECFRTGQDGNLKQIWHFTPGLEQHVETLSGPGKRELCMKETAFSGHLWSAFAL